MKDTKQLKETKERVEKRPYETPAIIYTTQITTRAGSPLTVDNEPAAGVDPADLFGD
ncbi:MAG: hypothetical protein KC415_23630 [Anaerolineales bacterium]|nr:hypothetical protein [Anaerolineales bacterium]MCB8991084.1 hypothetical protein [Ardenticatenaceae bacterium]MCB9004126.1 hypothetical protein [Ardenticatenaceae bacterium]